MEQKRIDFYAETFRVFDWEADANRHMTPGAILRRAQQIATDHCDSLGMDAAFYAGTHTAFLMAKLAMECYRPMTTGQTLRLETRPFSPVRAVFHRLCDFIDEQGELCCTVDSRWVLVNADTHRILRQPIEGMRLPTDLPPQRALDIAIRKAPAQKVGAVRAGYTYCDVNGHMNNTRYADAVCDAVPAETLLARGVRRLAVAYHNELALGEEMDLLRAEVEDGWYIAGESEGKKRFEAQLTLG